MFKVQMLTSTALHGLATSKGEGNARATSAMTTASSATGGLPAWQDPKGATPLSDPLITGVGRAHWATSTPTPSGRGGGVLEETLQGLGGLDARTQACGAAAENVAR